MGCQEKLIVLINSPLRLSPLSSMSAERARVPLGRGVCFGPISITHLAEQRGRGASGRQAVINCLSGLLLLPGCGGYRTAPPEPGPADGWEGSVLLILPPLSPLNPYLANWGGTVAAVGPLLCTLRSWPVVAQSPLS